MTPDALTAQALLNCLIREVAPQCRTHQGEIHPDQIQLDQPQRGGGEDEYLDIRLPVSGVRLRARLARPSAGLAPRLTGEADEHRNGGWRPLPWRRLATLTARELTLATGRANPEFASQVADSHAATAAILAARGVPAGSRDESARDQSARGVPPGDDAREDSRIARYLASEQALVAGHRFHPAPKARQGAPHHWLRYAPEATVRFPLRFLAVREDLIADAGDVAALGSLGGPAPPPGYGVLPAHPWQLERLADSAWLRAALCSGLVRDLGEGVREVVPTSSVRTVYDPAADVFCKFSLDVRLTNCVRVSAWYELAGSVALTSLLTPVLAGLAARFPRAVLLTEPGYRTVAASDKRCYEGLAVIVRDGLAARLAPGVTPLLAASLIEPAAPWPGPACLTAASWPVPANSTAAPWPGPIHSPAPAYSPVAPRRAPAPWPAPALSPATLVAWWEAYVRLVVPPVLDLLVTYGVALEPHLQNVIVGVGHAGLPAQVIFRDLEGAKLVRDAHAGLLARLPAGVAPGLGYERERAWDRVLYCLIVNHLDQIAAAIADRCPDPRRIETELWDTLRETLAKCAADLGEPARLRALLDGAPLPAKANLRVRWDRAADREAAYLALPSPWDRR